MSRSGYTDDCDGDYWSLIRWRGAVASGIRGKRGQAMLVQTLEALDAMPVKELATDSLINAEGQYCTLGVLGAKRGIDLSDIDPDDREDVAGSFGISEALAAEIMYLNDESVSDWEWQYVDICGPLRPCERRTVSMRVEVKNHKRKRWQYMRDWIAKQIKAV